MDRDLMTTEDERKMRLNEALNNGRDNEGATDASTRVQVSRVSLAQWLIMFSFAGLAWLAGLIADLLIPLITIIVNYLVVLWLWMWAKSHGLKPPTFASATKGAGRLAGAAGQAGKGTVSAVEPVPGSDLTYVLLGGLTPLIYLAALWWNNRS